MTSEETKTAQVCVNCGKHAAHEVRRDEIFGRGPEAIIIENIPVMQCHHCGLTWLEPEVSRRIDEICAHPEQYAEKEYRPVAKIA